MTPYQQCPYCETVIEIDSDNRETMKRHIRVEHMDDERTERYRAV